jgi:hypothetical protein
MLPHVIRYTCLANMERFRRIAYLMGEKVEHLFPGDDTFKAAEAVETPTKDIGLPRDSEIWISRGKPFPPWPIEPRPCSAC